MTEERTTLPTKRRGAERRLASVASLDMLVAAHRDALADLFEAGAPADVAWRDARAKLLAFDGLGNLHVVTRPLVRAVSRHLVRWHGLDIDAPSGGGSHHLVGGVRVAFHTSVESSRLDGAPALCLDYGAAANSWPFGRLHGELRKVGESILVGPTWLGSGERPLLWLGVARS
jgi:hypothetical protein